MVARYNMLSLFKAVSLFQMQIDSNAQNPKKLLYNNLGRIPHKTLDLDSHKGHKLHYLANTIQTFYLNNFFGVNDKVSVASCRF